MLCSSSVLECVFWGKKVLCWIYCTLVLLSQLFKIKPKFPLTGGGGPTVT